MNKNKSPQRTLHTPHLGHILAILQKNKKLTNYRILETYGQRYLSLSNA